MGTASSVSAGLKAINQNDVRDLSQQRLLRDERHIGARVPKSSHLQLEQVQTSGSIEKLGSSRALEAVDLLLTNNGHQEMLELPSEGKHACRASLAYHQACSPPIAVLPSLPGPGGGPLITFGLSSGDWVLMSTNVVVRYQSGNLIACLEHVIISGAARSAW